MKKIAGWIVCSLLTGLLAAGCVAPVDSEQSEELAEPEVSPQAWVIRTTTYYAEPQRINEVGQCIWQICWSPKGTTCWGTTTPYYTVESESSCY